MRTLLVAAIAFAVLCGGVSAQMYRWVDKDGRVHYTQTPPPPDARRGQNKTLGSGTGGAIPYAELPYATQTAARNFPITLYTAPECGAPCDQARGLLVKRAVPFREISVQAQKEVESLKTLSGSTQLPFLLVGNQKQSGFLEEAYSALLDSAGYASSGPRLPVEALRKMDAPAKASEATGSEAASGEPEK
jgi:glutaredoxin